jgi:glycerol-3-phosphate acyltransferase PlsY
MVNVFVAVAAVGIAYLLGSFPAGYLLGRLWGVNVLQWGSGRTGGTNVFRSPVRWT